MNKPFSWYSFELKKDFGVGLERSGKATMSSSLIDANIIQHKITNRRTIHFFMSINDNGIVYTKNIDLTESKYGSLDFVPDEILVKYIGFQSQHNNQHDDLLYLDCDFINENTTLVPFHPKHMVQSFNNLRYTCKYNMDIRNVNFNIRAIHEDTEATPSVQSGSVICGIEFIRYARINDY